ncbi:MAG TPA: hypothetical protein VMZ91_05125 [Candidatus Paceibacterota bacterium]|nr:hypothetical protein [Candidatus Paceibacterota bacterium]
MDNFAEVVIPEIEPEPEEDIIKEEEPLEPEELKEDIFPVVEEKKKLNQEEIFVRTSKKKPLEIQPIKDDTDLIKEKVLKLPKNNKKIYHSILESNNIKFAKSTSIDKLREKIINNKLDFEFDKLEFNKKETKPKETKPKETKPKETKPKKPNKTININEPYSKKDLEEMVFNGIQQYEALRKERKAEKEKQKEIDAHKERVKNTIQRAVTPSQNDIYSKCFNF